MTPLPPRLEKLIEERQKAKAREELAKLTQYGGDQNTSTMLKTTNVLDVVDELVSETALAAWNAALEAVREGVPEEPAAAPVPPVPELSEDEYTALHARISEAPTVDRIREIFNSIAPAHRPRFRDAANARRDELKAKPSATPLEIVNIDADLSESDITGA
jgi:hypothetical protein